MSDGPAPQGREAAARPIGSVAGLLGFVGLLFLTAGLLVMHGLDPSVHAVGAEVATHDQAPDHHVDRNTGDARDDGGCPDCGGHGHLVAVCVAVLATVAGVGAFRVLRLGWPSTGTGVPAVRRFLAATREGRARAPVPTWVRLGVMRC